MKPRIASAAASLACAFFLTGAAVSAQSPRTAAPSKTLEALQGTWVITVADGQDLAGSGQEVALTITGNAYVQTMNGQVVERGTFKIDDTKKPIALDLSIAEGDDAGQSQVGVLELDAKTGKTMYGKIGNPGTTARPTDFAPSEGYFTFTAVKK
jgi:uncharacterized protein (TIGR03067 family)